MKLLLNVMLLLSGARSGRPSSHGVLFSTDLLVDSWWLPISCFPQNTQIDGDWRRECVTADECCSKRISKSAVRAGTVKFIYVCGCIPSGQYFEGDANNCCSGVAENKICGCLAPNTGPQSNQTMRTLPLNVKDCCHKSVPVDDTSRAATRGESAGYTVEQFKKCGPRQCASPGTAPAEKETCCGGRPAYLETEAKIKACGCIPARTVVNPELETVEGSMCCSGSFTSGHDGDTTRACGCIPGGQELPGLGASGSDCCTQGLNGNKYCKSENCTLPHKQKETPADYCCTDIGGIAEALNKSVTTGRNDYCGCIKGGIFIDADKESWCCSGRRSSDGKCTWISFRKRIHLDYMTETECFSGRAEDETCLCMKPGSALRGDLAPEHRSECCSDGLNMAKNRCSCILAGEKLRLGSKREDCCTELTDPDKPDVCYCGPIGLPYAPKKALGMKPTVDCCSQVERNGYCACVKPGEQASAEFCCAGHNGTACKCQPEGTVVNAGNTAKDVCCSGSSKTIKDGDCKVEVCGEKPAYCSRLLLRLTKVEINNLAGQGPDVIADPCAGLDVMVFPDVFPDLGRRVNLVISNTTSYVPNNNSRNGMKGPFGVLNVKSGNEVGLRFGFVNAATGAAEKVPGFLFTFLDLDTSTKGGGQEYVKVMGYKDYRMAANTVVTAKPVDDNSGFFWGSKPGFGYDNPRDLKKMTEHQTQRLVSFEFPSSSGFDIIFGSTKGAGGRNVFFGGGSELYC